MKRLLFLLLIVLAAPVLADIQVGAFTPTQVDLCGEYQSYVTLTASDLINTLNMTLQGVKVKLMITGSPGLAYVTSQEVYLGDIGPLGSPSINPQWTIQCSNPAEGIYSAYMEFTALGFISSSLGQAESVIVVHTIEPLEVNVSLLPGLSLPQNNVLPAIVQDNTPTVKVSTNRDAVCKGSLDKDESYEQMDFIFFGTQGIHEYTFASPITEGLHSVYVKCRDNFDYTMQISTEIRFIVDTNSPGITVRSPKESVSNDFAYLEITTDEEAECRYHEADKIFKDMIKFESTNKTTFSTMLYDLELGENTISIRCKDLVGNERLVEHEFKVELPPTATVSFSKAPPLKAGTYEVTVLPSKTLLSIPTLSYSFTDSTTFSRYVSLEKSGNNLYTGYMIIEDYDLDRVGVFSFSGTDTEGVKGTEITEGATFLVDTNRPAQVTSIEATSDVLGDITLRWFYDSEQVERYNIYRSVSPAVDYIHLYSESLDDIFVDDDVQSGITYYYKVAAVDKAGNIGELSKAVSATSTKKTTVAIAEEQTVTQDSPEPATLRRFNDTMKLIERLLIDLEWAQTNLKEKQVQESIIDDLNLLKRVQDAQSDIGKLKNQMLGMSLQGETDRSLSDLLTKAENLVSSTEKSVPQSLEVTKKTAFVQSLTEQDFKDISYEFLLATNYSDRQKESYARYLEDIHTKIKVEGEIETFTIEYLDGNKESRIRVIKKVSHESPDSLVDIKLVEMIPKTVAGSVDAIDIRTPEYLVLNPDPIIAWNHDALSFEKKVVEYLVLSSDSSEAAKTTKTFVLIDPKQAIGGSSNSITGFVTKMVDSTQISFGELTAVLLGILVVGGLLMYYLVAVKEIPISLPKIPELGSLTQRVARNRSNQPSAHLHEMVPPDKYFFLANGDVIRSLHELKEMLDCIDHSTFYHHVNYHKNDFADWIRQVHRMHELAHRVSYSKTPGEIIKELEQNGL